MPDGPELFCQFINISATAGLFVIPTSIMYSANGSPHAHVVVFVIN